LQETIFLEYETSHTGARLVRFDAGKLIGPTKIRGLSPDPAFKAREVDKIYLTLHSEGGKAGLVILVLAKASCDGKTDFPFALYFLSMYRVLKVQGQGEHDTDDHYPYRSFLRTDLVGAS